MSMGMATYISATMERVSNVDIALGCPYREIVRCLLWIVLCDNGPDLVRVKHLAKPCNAPSLLDYQDAVKFLKGLFKRLWKDFFKRGYAGRELIPSQSWPDIADPEFPDNTVLALVSTESSSTGHLTQLDILNHFDNLDAILDIPEIVLPTTTRFTTITYTVASSFAVGDMKDSISSYVIYVNGTPILWGSMKQSTGGDSTCAVEFVAASVCCKQLVHVENMFRFCVPSPILSIPTPKLLRAIIRHIAIRYHLVRRMALNREIFLSFALPKTWLQNSSRRFWLELHMIICLPASTFLVFKSRFSLSLFVAIMVVYLFDIPSGFSSCIEGEPN